MVAKFAGFLRSLEIYYRQHAFGFESRTAWDVIFFVAPILLLFALSNMNLVTTPVIM